MNQLLVIETFLLSVTGNFVSLIRKIVARTIVVAMTVDSRLRTSTTQLRCL